MVGLTVVGDGERIGYVIEEVEGVLEIQGLSGSCCSLG